MSKAQKLLLKIQQGLNNTTMSDILNLMNYYGFNAKRTSHGYIFSHSELKTEMMPHVAEPNGPNSNVLKCYVKDCLKAIELLESRKEEKK